ncbi:cupredoxin domain-containing protein [Kineococcus gypseus]|uniref:cupredoxin domain-containing protein n=1 Tax=Kineococcus gypseus TaxID=1637102 RepID=UPI003D7E9AC5
MASAALAVVAATTVVAHTVLAGTPNPGMAAIAVLPLGAALALRSRRRRAALPALVVVPAVAALRAAELSFDLSRPGDLVPFAVAAVQVVALGTAFAAAAATAAGGRGPGRRAVLPLAAAATALSAVTAALVLVLSPQTAHTGDLTAAQVRELPAVSMTNYRFGPSQLRAEAGTVALRFTNTSDDAHTFALEELGVDVLVPSGRERTVVLDVAPGTYRITCTAGDHLEEGMEGRLTVVGTGATVEGASAPAAATTSVPAGGHHHG